MFSRFARLLGHWRFVIFFMATIFWLTIADRRTAILETHPDRMYLIVEFAIERYEQCDPTGFGNLTFAEKRNKVVELFVRQTPFNNDAEVNEWKADFDWTQEEKPYINMLRNYYHRNANYTQCMKLLEMINRNTDIFYPSEDKIVLENYIIKPTAEKVFDGEINDYNSEYLDDFTANVASCAESARNYVTFWIEALLACNLASNESLRSFGKNGIFKNKEPTLRKLFGSKLWPADWTNYTVLRQQYNEALEAKKMAELKQLGERYYKPGTLGQLPEKLLHLLEVDTFGAVMSLTTSTLLDWKEYDRGKRAFLNLLEIKFQLYLLATEKVYEAWTKGKFIKDPGRFRVVDPPSGFGHKLCKLVWNPWTLLACSWTLDVLVAWGAYYMGRNSIDRTTIVVQTTTAAVFEEVITSNRAYIVIGALLLVIMIGYWFYKSRQDDDDSSMSLKNTPIGSTASPASMVTTSLRRKRTLWTMTRASLASLATPATKNKKFFTSLPSEI